MENYGHGGRTSPEGEGMGVFTIYDWGNGAAAEAAMRIRDHFGDVYIDDERDFGIGIDKVSVSRTDEGWVLVNEAEEPRLLRVVFADGSMQEVKINDQAMVREPTRR